MTTDKKKRYVTHVCLEKKLSVIHARLDKNDNRVETLEEDVNSLVRAYSKTWKTIIDRLNTSDGKLDQLLAIYPILEKIEKKTESIETQTKRTVSHLTSEAKVRSDTNKKIMDQLRK